MTKIDVCCVLRSLRNPVNGIAKIYRIHGSVYWPALEELFKRIPKVYQRAMMAKLKML